jgi:hypothetical protein
MEYPEKSYEEHSHWLIYLHIDPSMDGLRSHQRFQDLLWRVGLPLQRDPPPEGGQDRACLTALRGGVNSDPKVQRPRRSSAGPPVVCLGLAEGAKAFANPNFART